MSDHALITRLAFEALPRWQHTLWKNDRDAFINDYCSYPDSYWEPDRHHEIQPYMLLIDGMPFHYSPPNQIDYNNWAMDASDDRPALRRLPEKPNRNWSFVSRGMNHYLEKSLLSAALDQMTEAGKWLGVLVHFIEDSGHVIHALEGPDGADAFILDRLCEPPSDNPHRTASSVLTEFKNDTGDISGHRPRLLGASIPEITFHLYSAIHRLAQQSRFKHLPVVRALLGDDRDTAAALLRGMDEDNARLVSDLLFTVLSVAKRKFLPRNLASLSVTHLEELYPLARPWVASDPYRFTPLVANACLDQDRRPHPLRVLMPDRSVREFRRGWGSGTHIETVLAYDVPRSVFDSFHMTIGLHEPLGRKGRVRILVKLDRDVLFDHALHDRSPSARVSAVVRKGGVLRIVTRALTPSWSTPDNNLVWGEPHLLRADDAPVWERQNFNIVYLKPSPPAAPSVP